MGWEECAACGPHNNEKCDNVQMDGNVYQQLFSSGVSLILVWLHDTHADIKHSSILRCFIGQLVSVPLLALSLVTKRGGH